MIKNNYLGNVKRIAAILILIFVFTPFTDSNGVDKTSTNKQLANKITELQKKVSNKNIKSIYNAQIQNQLKSKVSKLTNIDQSRPNIIFCSYKYKTRFVEKDKRLLLYPLINSNQINIVWKGTVVKVLYCAIIDGKANSKDLWLFVNIPVYDTPQDNFGWIKESDTVQYTKSKIKYVLREVYTKAGKRAAIERKGGNLVYLIYPGGDSDWVNAKDIIYPKVE